MNFKFMPFILLIALLAIVTNVNSLLFDTAKPVMDALTGSSTETTPTDASSTETTPSDSSTETTSTDPPTETTPSDPSTWEAPTD
ncbi:uncharacterized protein LOC130677188 [Microplitis mediator]|uniref:uncharacterized protein LOC130677188 n=1 Tax=Microplitis mediator TaxID=375433 RepID=UPI002553177B|nr:uncharacterized protein LOC130677188 [Microplitis mediator]